ncbi:MAG: hypothetical protein ICV83_29590 [Cytophagales bacterium]|nr:hypothetical protein [Cytophagales bacterium]
MLYNYTDAPTKQSLRVNPTKIAKVLLMVVGGLFVLNAIGIYMNLVRRVSSTTAQKLFAFFDLNKEANVPTFFNSFLLLFAALLLFVVAWQDSHRPPAAYRAKYWRFLGACFLLLSVDEAVEFHEWVGIMMKIVFAYNFTGIFYYAWTIPYALLLLGGFLFIKNFLFGLPGPVRNRFIVAGIMFVGGAIGLEMLEAQHADATGSLADPQTLYFAALYSLEEVLEMSAVILFIHTLLGYLAATQDQLVLQIKNVR